MRLPIAMIATAAALMAAPAFAELGVEFGVLTCKLKDVHNDIVYTSEKFACDYKPKTGDAQTYEGEIKSVGVDLSVTEDTTLVWGVVATGEGTKAPDSLKGSFFGGTAAAEVGAGAGAGVLVGGGDKSIALNPISVSGVEGVGASLDLSEFELR
ncbi:MAG TPA: DUF992 domain-containing protein [Amaricoccus sp.]|uniref:DUF992 domain-containing protein n=1 Tax=Amaricoccus sp. TaxID=1872485 RepID=UPI002B851065|nr:DUF992 domain-containing protein [Amaricoccus sp.]HMQ93318.1 DUF992 domain-containing protein [Amaricoccus sp.]HMR53083.1 DUF992 domain-containing protein [Amaricoccus sp.]HMR60369.1 DUF992 domain-containing protein [Amaricoccus sp.]HMT99964.1 DUF992 domain-containing protein [Amaricoccus sp.]